MSPSPPALLIAPLSLCNVLTIVCALACLWRAFLQEARGRATGWRDLVIPPAGAAAVALMLLAGVFDATVRHDAEWLVALAAGAWIGRVRRRTLPVEIDREGGIRLPRAVDSLLVAALLVVAAVIDFVSSARATPVIGSHHVAAIAAFCAGFLGSRTFTLFGRAHRTESGHPPGPRLPADLGDRGPSRQVRGLPRSLPRAARIAG